MLGTGLWRRISSDAFELLALEHVKDLYPEYSWTHTRYSGDGGADGIGSLADSLAELYWMEAKHHPGSNLGKYTLDTHLVSAFFTRGRVKRLHVVTSGKLSGPFLLRADSFASDHGFEFAYTDQDPLEAWLCSRPDAVARFFAGHVDEVQAALDDLPDGGQIFCRATVLPEDDSLHIQTSPALNLVPGQKYLLVLAFSTARRIDPACLPLRIRWEPDPGHASTLSNELAETGELAVTRLSARSIVTVPFRLLRTGRELAPVRILDAAERTTFDVPLPKLRELVALTAPFVGAKAQEQLIRTRRILVEEVANGRPRLLVLTGRAGSGKSRLAEELRDDAQRLGFLVKRLQFSPDLAAQRDQWILLFRWTFGLEHNPFELDEAQLLGKAVDALGEPSGSGALDALTVRLRGFLVDRAWDEGLFDPEVAEGRLMAHAVERALRRRLAVPLVLHLEDSHHLSRSQMGPLYLLRHIVEAADTLPVGVIVAARDDETVVQRSIHHFVRAVEITGSDRSSHWRVADLDHGDARNMVAATLRIPELWSRDWHTVDRVIQRAGTNPFALMQTLNHLVFDRGAIGFSFTGSRFFVDLAALKEALRGMPAGIDRILSSRFRGLLRRGEGHLLDLLAAAAVWGKEVPLKVLQHASGAAVRQADIRKLLSLGYLAQADTRRVVLAHDLLVEALLRRREKVPVARRLVAALESPGVPPVDDGRRAAIYFHAGPRHHAQSWTFADRAVLAATSAEDHRRALEPIQLLEAIAKANPARFSLTPALRFMAALTHQHCGNTARALEMFLELREEAVRSLTGDPTAPARYIESTIEACNQYFLRATPSEAVRYADDALAALADPALDLAPQVRAGLRALAHNRRGAALHLADNKDEAAEHYEAAMLAAEEADDAYLLSHTLSDFASLLRFRDPARTAELLRAARETWRLRLPDKERRRIMLDTQEAYDACLHHNTSFARMRLYGIASEAAEKGYMFQAASALLCFACGSLIVSRVEEAADALVRVLDLTTLTEDYRARIFAFHYAAVCADSTGDAATALHWNDQALRLVQDPLFGETGVRACLLHNDGVLRGGEAQPPACPEQWQTGRLVWYRFDRS